MEIYLVKTYDGLKPASEDEWQDIPGYEGLYQASISGFIKSLDRTVKCRGSKQRVIPGRIIKSHKKNNGYIFVRLTKNKKSKNKYLHRLVLKAFSNKNEWKDTVNHIDGNKENNCLSNLEWASRSENLKHAYKNGLNKVTEYQKSQTSKANRGSKQHFSRLSEENIPEIRDLYSSGMTYEQIGEKYSVHRETIGNIIRGNTWRHV